MIELIMRAVTDGGGPKRADVIRGKIERILEGESEHLQDIARSLGVARQELPVEHAEARAYMAAKAAAYSELARRLTADITPF